MSDEPNIMPRLLREAVHQIAKDSGRDPSDLAHDIRVDGGDFTFWLTHTHLDRPWFRAIDREVEQLAVVWAAKVLTEQHGRRRLCPRCKQMRPWAEFYSNGYCKPCGRDYSRERYLAQKQERQSA